MTTLYNIAESNIRKTWLLMGLFLIFIIGLGWLFSYILKSSLILVIAVLVSFLLNIFSYWFSDKVVLSLTKAKPIKKEQNPELYRIVENLCLSAGLPLPKIYIIPEQQPNAFATGRNEKHAVVAVTKGLLERLERVEIEGVIAHELSHIKNKDILLQTVVVILAGMIALASHWFLRISFWGGFGRRDSRDTTGNLLFLVGVISALLAPLAATLIKLAISRKREFLADASGALLTRYPEGLARALEKISKDETPMKIASPATSHLFIASPFKGEQKTDWLTRLFSTHPPVQERIRLLREMEV